MCLDLHFLITCTKCSQVAGDVQNHSLSEYAVSPIPRFALYLVLLDHNNAQRCLNFFV